jgi:transposase
MLEQWELAGKEGMSQRKIAKIYGVSPTTIYKIIKNISYKIKENSYV